MILRYSLLLLLVFWFHYDDAAVIRPRQHTLTAFRGGSTYPNNNKNTNQAYHPNNNPPLKTTQQQQQQQEGFAYDGSSNNNNNPVVDNNNNNRQGSGEYYNNPGAAQQQEGFYNDAAAQQPEEDFFINDPQGKEAYQDRIDAWKQKQQQEQQAFESAAEQLQQKGISQDDIQNIKRQSNPLMASVTKGTRVIIFFLFVWRNIHFYELADDTFRKRGFGRILTLSGLLGLFLLNLFGTVVSGTTNGELSHAQKKRLKSILNLDKLVEVYLVLLNLVRLTFYSPSNSQREIMLASMLHSVFFVVQAQGYTRVNWSDHKTETPAFPQNDEDDGDYYYGDDYTNQQQQQGYKY